ncbi:hypothetical protein MKK68_18780 [Methylobacterium sp. E-016]|uniref:hypothetical protein n=1 Tax=Methylobacterium sp. E-016 TaxID=2836556 RepID=UPI001FB97013|nr:hypothetical protein [Methylobacterium sp. E-016]MCJ2077669.1 hypothetical protein [Methylobacterium sp. E-016]
MSSAKPVKTNPVSLIDDAFLENILESSESELLTDLMEEGLSPESVLSGLRALVSAAENECAQARLGKAKEELAAFRGTPGVGHIDDLQQRRERLAAMRVGSPSATGMMMAARKGEGLSERDQDGLLDDLADLDRLSARKDEGDL